MAISTSATISELKRLPGDHAIGTTLPSADSFTHQLFRLRFLIAWVLGWALVGFLVGAAIAFTTERFDLAPLLRVSILLAEVLGFTALISARMVFPLFDRLPFAGRIVLQAFTLFSGTVFGSTAVLVFNPFFSLAQPRTVAMIVLVNAVLAVIVGIALHTYDSMSRQIERSYQTLKEKEALERDLEIAREVQRELLPRAIPEFRGLELAGICQPAVAVGGDLFDFIPFTEDSLGIVIADVSGKGIPAALLMAGLQASVRSLAIPSLLPAETNRRLNELLYRSTSASRYATFFLGLYDAQTREMTYSNAGHHPPIQFGANGNVHLSEGGLPIGVLDKSTYLEGRKTLESGDLLALFTDGIIETPDVRGEEFGEDRLIDVIHENRDKSLDDILSTVVEDLSRWADGAPPFDDLTLVLARAR